MEGANIASPLLTASIQYIINVLLTLPAILYLDKFGRRPALVIGSFLMMTWLFITGKLLEQLSKVLKLTGNRCSAATLWTAPGRSRFGRQLGRQGQPPGFVGYRRVLVPLCCYLCHDLGSDFMDVPC